MWPDGRIQELFGIELPIIQAPMAGAGLSELAVAVAEAGGLGSLPCALLSPDQCCAPSSASFASRPRSQSTPTSSVIALLSPMPSAKRRGDAGWSPTTESSGSIRRRQFRLRPARRSARSFAGSSRRCVPRSSAFIFGLPERHLLARVVATGAKVISSATSVDEARWLESEGCDAIIAQGAEAGGHRGMFRTEDIATQMGTFALVPQVVDAVKVPVIAAGGIGDARGIAAAFMLGASAVQIGTAYLFCPESTIADPHRKVLLAAKEQETALTNVFTGRPARGIVNRIMREVGPMSPLAPAFPLAGGALAPLRAAIEPTGSGDFMSLWSGQSAALCRPVPATQLTRELAEEAHALLRR